MRNIFLLLLLVSTTVYAAVGSNLDSVTVGSYLYPKTTGLPLGSSTAKWAGWLSSINGADIEDAVLPSGGSSVDYLTGARTWANLKSVFSGTAPISYSSGVFSCDVASGSQPGCLSAANWTTFNNKEPAITAGATTTYLRGDKTAQTLNTSAVPESGNLYYTDARARAALSGTAPIAVSAGGVVSIADGSSTVPGALTISAQGIAGEKTFESPIVLKESATPSNPPALKHKIYPKSDGKLYRLNSAGTETEIGGSSGGSSAKVARFTCGQGVPAANTVNLINFDSATFYDYGVPGIAGWSYTGSTCSRSTSSPKFGAGWLQCTSTGKLQDTSPETLITIATGAFSIDYWVQLTDINESGQFGAGDGGALDDGDMEFYWNNGDTSWKFVSKAGATTTTVSGSDPGVTTGVKYHIEVTRSGSTVYIFRDGVLKGSGTSNNNLSLTSGGTKTLYFGWAPSVNEGAGGEFFDEIRISDVARHTSGFTPETTAYPITNTISKDPNSMISSVTGGTDPGACTVNFTGSFFSLEPACQCQVISATAGEANCRIASNNTTSAASLVTRVNGASANASVYLSCQE